MIGLSMRLEGMYYDGSQPVAVPAALVIEGSEAALAAGAGSRTYPTRELRVSPRVGGADRFIAFPDGRQFQCSDGQALDHLPQEAVSEGIVAWLEKRVGVALASVAIVVCVLLAGYFYGVPAAAESVASRIPVETEKSLGEEVLAWLDRENWINPPHVDEEKQNSIRRGFQRLQAGLATAPCCRLEFRCSKFLGANAFALPGGTIVITDQMVNAAETEEEILAVLAHEMGHVEGRHALRQMLQSSAVGLAAATIMSDASSVAAVGSVPALLAQMKYSREFETEADRFAFDLLRAHGLSPDAFASLMERLDEKGGGGRFSFLSTHPATSERVERARAAAGGTSGN